jgi:hypothetical protein
VQIVGICFRHELVLQFPQKRNCQPLLVTIERKYSESWDGVVSNATVMSGYDCCCLLHINCPPLNCRHRFVLGNGNQQTRRVKRVDTLVRWGLVWEVISKIRVGWIGKDDGNAEGGHQRVQLAHMIMI